MSAALRMLTVGVAAASLPLSLVIPATPAAAAGCESNYRVQVADGYVGRYMEFSQFPERPTCSVVTNTSQDGTVLLIRSTDGAVEPVISPDDTPSQWVIEGARQVAQNIVARNGTVVLPNESVVVHYSLTNTFTVSIARVRTSAASKLVDGIFTYGLNKARAAGLTRIENRINLQANIVDCAQRASEAWDRVDQSRTLPDLATVLQETAQAASGPCKTVYDTIKDFETRAPEPRPEPRIGPWQQTMEWARVFDRPYWENVAHDFARVPLSELILRIRPR
ncbi:hypothetical protein [Streptomyces sp. NPDC059994]|uniref:hypothetical protein n=1 Tax=Streptomyces sp. NPDC059994 TaxID=3347029 RepID=UPI00368B0A06